MNSRFKKVLAINLTLLILLLPLLTAAQTPIPRIGKVFTGYGVERRIQIPNRIRPLPTIPPRPSVLEIRRSPEIFRRAGGIMFDAVGQPCDAFANAELRLSYNSQRPDGNRLTLHIGNRAYPIPGITDNYLQPTAKFVDSKNPILANLQYPDEGVRDACELPSDRLRLVSLHPAFLNKDLGWSAIRMDSIPWSFSQGLRWDTNEPVPEATRELARLLGDALNVDNVEQSYKTLKAMTPGQKTVYAAWAKSIDAKRFNWKTLETEVLGNVAETISWQKLTVEDQHILLLIMASKERVSNLNDAEAPPTFCTQGSTVQFDGLPHLEFIAAQPPETFILPTSSKLMTENLPELRLIDQEAYDSMITVYRLGGLFRYVKQQSPLHWNQFVRTLPLAAKHETYAILCPSCPAKKLTEWVACVDKKFPAQANQQ